MLIVIYINDQIANLVRYFEINHRVVEKHDFCFNHNRHELKKIRFSFELF